MKTHQVQPGEYLSLLGVRYGVPWKKIWDDPANEKLRQRRKSPNILFPGDKVAIPDLEPHEESCATEQRHKFKLSSSKNKICVVVRDEMGDPVEGVEYTLRVGRHFEIKGQTGGDGMVKADVPEDAERARLDLDQLGRVYTLHIGELDPISRVSGVQQRLRNLGFDCGPADGIIGPKTRAALLRFQFWAKIETTGRADVATRKTLEKAHEGRTLDLDLEDGPGSSPAPVVTGRQTVEHDALPDPDQPPMEFLET